MICQTGLLISEDPIYSDGSFCTNKDETSQVAYVIFMADKSKKADVIDCGSNKSRKLVRSAPGIENFGLADTCDSAILILYDLKMLLGKVLKIKL